MAETAGDSSEVDSRCQQLGGGVVAQCVQVAVNSELGAHALVAVGDPAGVIGAASHRFVGEEESIIGWLETQLVHRLLVLLAVIGEYTDCCRVDGNPPHAMGLGVLFVGPPVGAYVVTPDGDRALGKVDVRRAQREYLGPPHSS